MQPIKEVTLERTYDASPETVWNAWTTPELLKKWWGPKNVTIPECTVDLKIGGKFYIVMEAGEGMGPYKGTLWPMMAEFTAIVPHSQLSYSAQAWTEGEKEDTTIDQTTDITFTEETVPPSHTNATDGHSKTKVTVKAAIYKTGPKAGMAAEGMKQSFTEQLEKLNGFLRAGK